MNKRLLDLSNDYARVAAAIKYLEAHYEDQPELEQVAAHVSLSPSHFQRLFSRWAGISPKRFLQYLTLKHTRKMLRESDLSMLDTTHSAGLSSVSRLHDLYLQCEAVTPAQYREAGLGMTVCYSIQPSPFGACVIGAVDRGLCHLRFVGESEEKSIEEMKRNWPHATFELDVGQTQKLCARIFDPVRRLDEPLYAVVKGTPFQMKVWEALLKIPMGEVVSYQTIACDIARPKASRAVANAIANNPLHYLIPCHRVIRSSGDLGGYRGGLLRKKAMLGWEAAKTMTDDRARQQAAV